MTSPAAIDYNCIAWAAGDTENWWQPGVYWPAEVPDEYGISALEEAFGALGFEPCDDVGPEPGFEKVALYGNMSLHSRRPTAHGRRWTSKLGKAEDIEHDTPDVVAGGLYGEVVEIMRRSLAAND